MSYLEKAFLLWMRHERIALPLQELRFAPPREWRFDFAWPGHLVAVEIEGLTRKDGGGRHQRVEGFVADAEKYEAALRLGWRVYRVPGQWVATPTRYMFREETLATIKQLLGVA